MECDENSKLLNGKTLEANGTRHSTQSVPFVRCVIIAGLSTFLIILVVASTDPIVSQYVHSSFLKKYIDIDKNISSYTNYTNSSSEDEPLVRAQEETSDFLLLLAITSNVPAIFVNVLLGSLSDYMGRKVLLLLPTIGILLRCVFCSFIIYFELKMDFFFLAFAIEGMGGSSCAFLAGVFSLAADITSSDRGRVVATTVAEVGLALSACTGFLMTGYLIPAIGYQNLNILISAQAFASCVLVLLLPETRERRSGGSPWSPITHFKNVFGFYVCKRKGDRKNTVLYNLLLAIFLFGVITILGRNSIETLYGLDEPFYWSSIQIGYFGALRKGLASLGSLVAIRFLQRHMRLETLALVGALDSVVAYVLEGLASTSWMLFLVPVVGIVSSTTVPIVRGTMSRMTSRHEQGAMFAGVGFFEAVANLSCQVLYTSVYSATVAFARGAVFFLMASFSGVAAILCVVWMVIKPKYVKVQTRRFGKISDEKPIFISSEICNSFEYASD